MNKPPLHGRLLLTLALLLGLASTVCAEPIKPKRGEVLKLEANSITAMPFLPPTDNQRSEPQTYVLDENTRIILSRLTEERTTPSGGKALSFKAEPGRREDLKLGQQVRIESENGRAVRITIVFEEP